MIRRAPIGIALLAGLAVPLVAGEGYFTHLAITMLISWILAGSLNLLIGYTGLVSIAHAAFFGIGGYTSGILVVKYRVPFWIALVLAMLVTAVVALGIGIPSFRTRGIYYIIVTVAFQLIASEMFDNWYSMTGGGLGLKGIPRPRGFESKTAYFYLVFVVAVLVQWGIIRIVRSPLGIGLMAVRDNETKALMLGARPLGYKTLAFVFASGLAGLAGSLYVHYLEYAHPEFFGFTVSVDLFLAVILGGASTLYGPAFGVLVLEMLREVLQEFAALRLLLFGALLIVLIVFLPGGLLPPILRVGRRLVGASGKAYSAPSPK